MSLWRSPATVLLAWRNAILRLARRRTVALRRRTAVLRRRRASVPALRTAVLTLGRRCLLLWVRRIGRRLAALMRVRRVRRCASAVALRRPRRRALRHERVARLARRRLALAGRRVALLRWVAVLRRPVAVPRLRGRIAVAVARTGRPAGRKHRAARPAARRRPRRREDDLASSLVRAERTKPRSHGGLGLVVLGEGNEAKSARLTGLLVPHHDDLAQCAEAREGYFQILLRVVLS